MNRARRPAVRRALGVSVHTGWGACVVVGGSLAKPEIIANARIEILGDAERFCYHMAAEMKLPDARKWLARIRSKALANGKRALARLTAQADICAIVAKAGDAGSLEHVLASHPRIQTAEGCFYRDVLREACAVPVEIVPPALLDAGTVGKLAPPPWGRDQRLAALAAWTIMDRSLSSSPRPQTAG